MLRPPKEHAHHEAKHQAQDHALKICDQHDRAEPATRQNHWNSVLGSWTSETPCQPKLETNVDVRDMPRQAMAIAQEGKSSKQTLSCSSIAGKSVDAVDHSKCTFERERFIWQAREVHL
jgi:hypothetical protein